MSLIINLVLPFPVTKPVGGAKIMYEYANRLAEKGHKITIYHSIKRPYKKSKTPIFIKQIIYKLRNVTYPKWFALHPSIICKIVPCISNKYIDNADVCMFTWWQMAYAVNKLDSSKGKKFNLIQDYEVWGGQNQLVDASFLLPITNIVIAKYLQRLVFEKSNKLPIHIPNAIDTSKFNCVIPFEKRNPFSIIMLYSKEERKGSKYGIAAFEILHKKYSNLSVVFFGVYERPDNLPKWITYYQKPSNLNSLYNEASIFLSPSLGEGWALPPAEAMICGCAVVCTNIGGHTDYAIDNETALLIQPKNVEDIVTKVETLLADINLKKSISTNGSTLIGSSFSWLASVNKLEICFSSC